MSSVSLFHQGDDPRRQDSSPSWGVGEGQRYPEYLGTNRLLHHLKALFWSPHSSDTSAIPELRVSGVTRASRRCSRPAVSSRRGLSSTSPEFPFFVNHFYSNLNRHLISGGGGERERRKRAVTLTSSSSQPSSLCLCSSLRVCSTICISYMYVVYVFTQRTCIYITKTKSLGTLCFEAFSPLSVVFHVHGPIRAVSI